jgi:hypothetical protein
MIFRIHVLCNPPAYLLFDAATLLAG